MGTQFRGSKTQRFGWFAAILVIVHLAGCADQESAPHPERSQAAPSGSAAVPKSTQEMAERLRLLVAQANPRMQITVKSREREAAFRDQIAGSTDLNEKMGLQLRLGYQLLVDGKTDAALQELQAIQAFFDRPGVQASPAWMQLIRENLALANLRRGELDNCLERHTSESCLMPIRGEGVHSVLRGSQAAVRLYSQLLEADPSNLRYRWLLNLAHMTLGQYPDDVPPQWVVPPEVFESEYDIQRFPDVAMATGAAVTGLAGGVVLDDLDEDGFLDLMVSDWAADKQLRFLHNNGDGTFADRTTAAGLSGETGGLNLCQADYDNDGDLDVFVLRGAWMDDQGLYPNSLLRNNGDGTFEDVTVATGVLAAFPTQTAAWSDYDNDGWIDLFVGNESGANTQHPCQLYRNQGDGTFLDVAASCGLNYVGFVKAVTWGDIDNDGRPDLFLSVFGGRNRLFHNEGSTEVGWSFRDVTEQAGVALPQRSFPSWFFDYNNDGWQDLLVAPFAGFRFTGESLDIVVADYLGIPTEASRTHLYRNERDGTFTNVAAEVGIDAAMLAMGANFGDLDNDGYLDCYFGTGDPYLGTLVPNRMFRNAGGTSFQDVTTSGGFGHIQKGHGIAFGDLDMDGDQDIYAVMGGSHEGDVYQNALFRNPGHGNHWLTLRLEGVQTNRCAIGARIHVALDTPEGPREVYATVGSGGSFGASSLQQEIGLGDANSIRFIEIRWPTSGTTQRFENVELDQVLRIREGDAEPVTVPVQPFELPDHMAM